MALADAVPLFRWTYERIETGSGDATMSARVPDGVSRPVGMGGASAVRPSLWLLSLKERKRRMPDALAEGWREAGVEGEPGVLAGEALTLPRAA